MRQRKKILNPLLLAITILLIIATSCNTINSPTDTSTTTTPTSGLIVSSVTGTTCGGYPPRNVIAIWIENNSGTFVKTLTVKAGTRKSDLTKWTSSSNGNTVDANTGATLSSFGTVTGIWNGTDANGKVVADGSYKVCMELTDKSSTGNYSSFTFTKGTVAETQTPSNAPSFSSISIKWLPL